MQCALHYPRLAGFLTAFCPGERLAPFPWFHRGSILWWDMAVKLALALKIRVKGGETAPALAGPGSAPFQGHLDWTEPINAASLLRGQVKS
jgi:hypothetical protein